MQKSKTGRMGRFKYPNTGYSNRSRRELALEPEVYGVPMIVQVIWLVTQYTERYEG